MAGAVLLPTAFLIGIQWGVEGLAWGWLCGMAALLAVTIALSLPVIGVSGAQLLAAVSPGWLSAAGMAFLVLGLDWLIPAMSQGSRLAMLVPFGIASYAALLFAFARPIVEEVLDLIRPKRPDRATAQTL